VPALLGRFFDHLNGLFLSNHLVDKHWGHGDLIGNRYVHAAKQS
jgi:hypothetical protein